MTELHVPSEAGAVAAHYGDLLDGFVLDEQDRGLHGTLGVPTVVTRTVMVTLADRIELARTVLEFFDTLR
jgi:LPPG:FO 2-phospho-L-lactate transferase